VFVLLGAVTIT